MGNYLPKLLIKSVVINLYAMLFFDEIKESEGLHAPEDTDFICTDMVSSNQCDFCHLYFFKN